MRFSIITSTYNDLNRLQRLRDVLNLQNFTDFEWIIADDGSNDGTDRWALKNADKYIFQEDSGYRLTKILNKAENEASRELLVWIMSDSYPDANFLKILNKQMDDKTLATGLRINVKDNKYHSHDWRTYYFEDKLNQDEINIDHYKAMTLNSMCMPKKMYEEMGGIFEGYDEGYGKMDWDMSAWAYYRGYKLKVFPKAIIYHDYHQGRKDTDHNTKLFLERLKTYENSSRL